MNQKLHFVHQLEKSYVAANLGDWIASPYYYYIEYFSKYTCLLHSTWAILWHEIENNDIVIFGGGGLIDNSDSLNAVLNRLLSQCKNVIIWGAGSHKYSDGNAFGIKSATTPIAFDKAAMVGIRDYKHPYNLPYLPCASCLHSVFDQPVTDIKHKRKVGVMRHGLDNSFGIRNIPSSITNAHPMGEIVKYIRESDVMLVTSYHGAYWSMLLGKKVIILESRRGIEKYQYFRHPVGFCDDDSTFNEHALLDIASSLPEPSGFLEESRELNKKYFEKVAAFIDSLLAPSSETETIHILSKRIAQLEFTLLDMHVQIKRMSRRLDEMHSDNE